MRREVRISIEGKPVHAYTTDRPLPEALDGYAKQARMRGTVLDGKRLRIEDADTAFERVYRKAANRVPAGL